MARTTSRNETPSEPKVHANMPELPKGYEEDKELSYPPYWKPEVGMRLYVNVMARDETNEEFVRYVLRALHPVMCHAGPTDDAREVPVDVGDRFTMSVYTALPLDIYFGLDIFIECVTTQKSSDPKKNDMFVWKVHFNPKDKKTIEARRLEAYKMPEQLSA